MSGVYVPLTFRAAEEARNWLRGGGSLRMPKDWVFNVRSEQFENLRTRERSKSVPEGTTFSPPRSLDETIVRKALHSVDDPFLPLVCDHLARSCLNEDEHAAASQGLSIELLDEQKQGVYENALSALLTGGQRYALSEGSLDLRGLPDSQLRALSEMSVGFIESLKGNITRGSLQRLGSLFSHPPGEVSRSSP